MMAGGPHYVWLQTQGISIEVGQHLLSHGTVVDTMDRYGSTPVFAAVRNGHEMVVACLLGIQGAHVKFEDGFGHTLLWWARKSGNTKVTEAIIQFARIRGIKLCEGNLAVEASSTAIAGSNGWYDVCTRFIPAGSASHLRSVCQVGDFDICLECFEMGARCWNDSHQLVLREPAVLWGST